MSSGYIKPTVGVERDGVSNPPTLTGLSHSHAPPQLNARALKVNSHLRLRLSVSDAVPGKSHPSLGLLYALRLQYRSGQPSLVAAVYRHVPHQVRTYSAPLRSALPCHALLDRAASTLQFY